MSITAAERCRNRVKEYPKYSFEYNDFKYLDKHFGMNQITGYASVSYKDLCRIVLRAMPLAANESKCAARSAARGAFTMPTKD